MNDGESLLKAITSEPDGNTAALVFADWLQEHGAGELASLLRDAVQLRSEQAKVWVATSGSYSDYGVDAVYSSKELADEYYKANAGGEANEPKEFALNEMMDIIQKYRNGYQLYNVIMKADGTNSDVYLTDVRRKEEFYLNNTYAKDFYCCCFATSPEHAVKICNEKRIQYLATNGVDRPKS